MKQRIVVLWLILSLHFVPGSLVKGEEQPGTQIRVIPFRLGVSPPFIKHFVPERHLLEFTERLVDQIKSSKSLEIIASIDTSIDRDRVGAILDSGATEKTMVSLFKADSNHAKDCFIVGRVRDDRSNILFAEAKILAWRDNNFGVIANLYAEGSQAEASSKGSNLVDYLVAQLVLQVETQLDDRIRVLVAPFKDTGRGSNLGSFGEMIGRLVSGQLSISQRIRVIRESEAYNFLQFRNNQGGEYRDWTIPEPGKREAAKYLVTGTFAELQNFLLVEASQIDLETGHIVIGKSVLLSTSPDTLFDQLRSLGDELRKTIEIDFENKYGKKGVRVGVVAVPPFPVTGQNTTIALNIARTVTRKLQRVVSGSAMTVVLDQARLEQYVSNGVDRATMARELNCDYLVTVFCDRPVPYFSIRLESYNVRSPLEQPRMIDKPVDHLDHLDEVISSATEELLRDLGFTETTPPLDSLRLVEYPQEAWGLRMRGSVIGFIEDSRDLFLGNNFRYALEGTLIIYVVPWQLEFSAIFDLGKTVDEYQTIGRYFTFLARRNFVVWPATLRDMRMYLGAGIAAINYERQKNGAAFGVVIGGLAFSTGIEVLIWRGMYLDFNLGLLLPVTKVDGFDGEFNIQNAWLTSFNIGLGLGYRF